MQEPLRSKPSAKAAAVNLHTFHPMDVPAIPFTHSDEAAILYTQIVDVTIDSILTQRGLPEISERNRISLTKKLRDLLYLAGCFQFASIQLKLDLNELQFQVINFEFVDEGMIYFEQYHLVADYFHRILTCLNIMELLRTNDKQGRMILQPKVLLECFQDEAKQKRLFLLQYNVCFEVMKAGVLTFDQLWNSNDNVLDNLKMDACYILVLKGKIGLNRLPFLTPQEHLFLNHPTIVMLILEGRLLVDDWRCANRSPATQLARLVAHDPRTHESFVKAIIDIRDRIIDKHLNRSGLGGGFRP